MAREEVPKGTSQVLTDQVLLFVTVERAIEHSVVQVSLLNQENKYGSTFCLYYDVGIDLDRVGSVDQGEVPFLAVPKVQNSHPDSGIEPSVKS